MPQNQLHGGYSCERVDKSSIPTFDKFTITVNDYKMTQK